MELRAGYKQTEVGVIPQSWEAKPISELVDRVRLGGNYPNSEHETSRPLIKMGNIGRGNILTSIEYVPEPFPINEQLRLRSGDVLFNTRNTLDLVGKICVWRDELPIAYYNSNVLRLEFAKDQISSFYFANYALNSHRSILGLREIATGTTSVAAIYTRDLLNFKIATPTLPEQRVIAKVLSDADALIASMDALIAKKRDLKQAAMQQLLTGKSRLRGFKGKWEVKTIGPEIDLLTGFPFPSTGYSSIGVRLLRGSNVKRGKTDWSDDLVEYWPDVAAGFDRYELAKGDLVIAMDGSLVGRSYARLGTGDLPALLLQRVARIRSKEIDNGYLAQFVGSERFIKYCDSVKTVTAIPHISPQDIRNFAIPLPPTISEQTAIAAVLSDMDDDITALEGKRDKVRFLKQGMMEELLTGRIRLT